MLYINKMPLFIALLFLFVSFFSCKKEDDFALTDDIILRDYLQRHNISNYIKDEPSGIYYQLLQAPENIRPISNSEIEVAFSYSTTDTLPNMPPNALNIARLKLEDAIIAWQLIFPKLPIGTRALLFVPSRFAYGKHGLAPDIPPHSVMIFYIELLNIHPSF